jgi:hypothetical protein
VLILAALPAGPLAKPAISTANWRLLDALAERYMTTEKEQRIVSLHDSY